MSGLDKYVEVRISKYLYTSLENTACTYVVKLYENSSIIFI